MKKNNKGFTIVELVIVIAVIAILAAVLIPTFSSLVKTAKVSADTQLAKNMNTALAIEEGTEGKNTTFADAMADIFDAGYSVDKLTPTSEGCSLVWDQDTDRIVFFDKNDKMIYSENNATNDKSYHLWKVAHKEGDISATFSNYLADDYNGDATIDVSTGLDVGSNTDITTINYTNQNAEQNVIIRTSGGTLNITAPLDTVVHYGESLHVNIIAIAGASFHENGKILGTLSVESGNVELAPTAEVGGIIIKEKSEGNTATELPKIEAKAGSKTGTIVLNTTDTEIKVETGAEVVAVAPGNDIVKTQLETTSDTIISGVPETTITTEVVDTTKAGEFEGGFGTEISPFIINSIEYFNKFRDPANEYADGGYYWSITSDLDLSNIELADTDTCYVDKFSGVIDFCNKEVRVQRIIQTNFIKTLSNATIKNLKFVISGQVGLVRLVEEGDILIENVSTHGSFNTSDNNLVPFVRGLNPYLDATLTFKNCVNNATCISTSSNGCSGLFVGTGWNTNGGFANEDTTREFKLTFDSCVNNGSLFASRSTASMLIANASLFANGMKETNVVINDCINNGTIYGNASQPNLAIGRYNYGSFTKAKYDYLNDSIKIWNGPTGVCELKPEAFGAITITDNKFNLQPVANADHYNLTFNFWNFDFSDKELTQQTGWGQEGKTIVLSSLDGVVVPSYSWRTEFEGKTLNEVTIGDATLYKFTDGGNTYMAYKGIADDTYYHKLREAGINNTVTLTAYDSEGKVLSIATYTYAD